MLDFFCPPREARLAKPLEAGRQDNKDQPVNKQTSDLRLILIFDPEEVYHGASE